MPEFVPIIVGFTGTRFGMTPAQAFSFNRWVLCQFISEFHHGDCIGADAEAAQSILLHSPQTKIHCRPCTFPDMRAHTEHHVLYEEKTPFARNRDIVEICEVLTACPYTAEEQPHGGTWYTIRQARKKKKQVVIFNPDGSVV